MLAPIQRGQSARWRRVSPNGDGGSSEAGDVRTRRSGVTPSEQGDNEHHRGNRVGAWLVLALGVPGTLSTLARSALPVATGYLDVPVRSAVDNAENCLKMCSAQCSMS